MNRQQGYVPLDGEASHTGLLGQNVAANAFDDGLGRRLGVELLQVVLIVDVVTDANKFATIVGAGQENHSDTEDIGVRDARGVGSASLEYELVDAHGDRTNKKIIEFLVVLVACGGTDVGELPLEICTQGGSSQ